MHKLTLFDHAFVLIVLIAFPAYSILTVEKVYAQLRRGGERVPIYREIIGSWSGFGLLLLVLWISFDRPWPELGFRLPDWQPMLFGLLISAGVIALIVLPIRAMALSPERGNQLDELMGDVGLLMPRTGLERRWFLGVSFNAGVTEEVIFRGYLIWYLGHMFGLLTAAAIAALWFALAHAYQGLKQIPGILTVSVVAVFLYIYTESLLVPMVFHFVLDALQGHYVTIRHQRKRAQSDSPQS